MKLSIFLWNTLYYTLHVYSFFICVSLCQHRSFAWLTECASWYISLSVSTPAKPAAFPCQRFVQVTNKNTIKENAGCDFLMKSRSHSGTWQWQVTLSCLTLTVTAGQDHWNTLPLFFVPMFDCRWTNNASLFV